MNTRYFQSIILVIFCCCTVPVFAQIKKTDSSATKETLKEYLPKSDILTIVDQQPPVFPGGKDAWKKFLLKNINPVIPLIKHAPIAVYKVRIRFMVDHTGALINVGAVSNAGYGMEDEVIRCIKKSPQWEPALLKSGHKVSYNSWQEVLFKVIERNCTIEVL